MVIDREPALTFDDVLMKPGYAGFFRSEIEVSTRLTREISLDIPLVSAPMDTVTDSRLAIALAHLGGIGIIHRNLTIDDQVAEITKVKNEGLLVGASVGSSAGYEKRVERLEDAGVDVVVVDSAHGFSRQVLETVQAIKKNHNIQVIGGNVATAEGALALIDAGVDGLRIGMGPGAICTTRLISGMGVPQLTAIIETSQVADQYDIPVIADGGINYSADIVKSLGAGACSVMLGRLFAGTEEACGQVMTLFPNQVPDRFKSILNGASEYFFKQYRGMGSLGAMEHGMEVSSEDEFHGKSYTSGDVLIAEGVEGLVVLSGSTKDLVDQLVGGLRSGLYYTGNRTIEELRANAHFQVVTQASLVESHPHDLFVTSDGGNYSL